MAFSLFGNRQKKIPESKQVTIMSGVKIGKGAVIGTKALVTKDIPDYAIAVGIPAKVIKYRFSPSLIKNLKNFDMSKLNESNCRKY